MLLQDKIAVVTGASRGIGRATAKALAREGAMVIVNYNGSKERADEVVSEIEKDGGKAKAIQCNVSDFEQAKEFFGGVVKEYGILSIWHRFLELSEIWDRQIIPLPKPV